MNSYNLELRNFEFRGIKVAGIELPDSSEYVQIISNNPKEDFLHINHLIMQLAIRGKYSQIRIVFPSKHEAMKYISDLTAIEKSISDQFHIIYGKTQYFEVAPFELDHFLMILKENAKGFICRPLDEQLLSSEDFVNLMINSFAFDFKNREYDKHKMLIISAKLANTFPKNTFVIEDEDGTILGSFNLVDAIDEIQLHSVAGRPMNLLSTHPNKLAVILYFAFLLAKQHGKTLTFNSSGAANLYKEIGIRKSKRFGVVMDKYTGLSLNSQP